MSDRIVLANMRFQGRHGYYDHELLATQPFEVDVELTRNLQPAGVDDDLTKSVDYGAVYEKVRAIVEFDDLPTARGDRRGHQPRAAGRLRRRRGVRPRPQAGRPAGRSARLRRRRDPAPPRREGPPRLTATAGAAAADPIDYRSGGRVARVTSRVIVDAVAQDLDRDRLAGRELAERRVERMLLVDHLAVDADDDVAVLDPGGRGRRAVVDARDEVALRVEATDERALLRVELLGPRRAPCRC